MQVRLIDIIGVLCPAVTGSSQIADDIAGCDDASLLEGFMVGIIFP